MEFDGPARRELRLALLDAFPDVNSLRRLVEETLGEPLQNVTGINNDMPTMVFDLIGWARARGRLTELVAGAAAENPGNAKLRAVANGFKFARPGSGEPERIVLPSVNFEDVGQWADKFARVRRRVCRVEPQPAAESIEGFGSGFLVGPDLVATAGHVADGLRAAPERAVLRFDCERAADGSETPGRTARLAGAGWLLADGSGADLDYALLRIDTRVGDDATPAGPRGHMRLTGGPVRKDEPVLILQHPAARPMQLAIGTVIDVADPARIGYTANTLGGSSGSPSMNSALEVVAIHHYGEDAANFGVRADRARAHAQAAGAGDLLG